MVVVVVGEIVNRKICTLTLLSFFILLFIIVFFLYFSFVLPPERERMEMQGRDDPSKIPAPPPAPRPAQSGLRTHQTRNM